MGLIIKPNYDLFLRNVENSDKEILLAWANDSEVRRWSFSGQAKITPDEHDLWFIDQSNNSNVRIWILEAGTTRCGQVRVVVDDNRATIHYSIAVMYRRLRFGSQLLRLAIHKIREEWPRTEIYALTLLNNVASQRTLEKACFVKNRQDGGVIEYIYDK